MLDALFERPLREEAALAESKQEYSSPPPAEGNPVRNDKAENPSMTRILRSKIKITIRLAIRLKPPLTLSSGTSAKLLI